MAARGAAGVLLVAWALAGCRTEVVRDAPAAPALAVPAENEPADLGRSHLAQGDFGLAQRQFQDAVEKNPDDGPSWLGLAAAYDRLGRFELADRAYRQAVRIEGHTLEVLNNLGYSHLLRRDRRGAMSYFRRALRLSPGNPVILNNIRLLETGERPSRATPL